MDALAVVARPVHAEPPRRVLEPCARLHHPAEVVTPGREAPHERVVLVDAVHAPPFRERSGLDAVLAQLGDAPEDQVLAVAPARLDDARHVEPVLGPVLAPVDDARFVEFRVPASTRDETRPAAPFVTRLVPKPQTTPKRPHAAEPLERLYADLELSGREDLNLRPFGPESGPGLSQGELTDAKSAQSLQTEGGGESSGSQGLGGFPKDFSTRFLPNSDATTAHGGAGAGGAGAGGQGAAKRPPSRSTAATLADLRVLWGGRDRLLKVAEVAEHLDVSNATVYGLCERGELRHVWVVTSMRIRPRDLEAFVAARLTILEKRRPHRRTIPPTE